MPEWVEKRIITGLPTKILRAAYVGEYGLEIDQQSALNLLMTMGDKTPPNEFRIFGPSDERFHIVEGNDTVPARLGAARHWRQETTGERPSGRIHQHFPHCVLTYRPTRRMRNSDNCVNRRAVLFK